MDFLPYSQEYMLIVSIMAGMFLGFIWDVYRVFRRFIPLGNIGVFIGDIAYWIISVWISIQIIYDICFGNIRIFILIGFLLGAMLYFYGISKYILKICITIILYIISIIRKFLHFIIGPLIFIKRKTCNFLSPYRLKVEKSVSIVKRRYKFFKYRLKRVPKKKKRSYNNKNIRSINLYKESKKDLNRKLQNQKRKGHILNERKSKNNSVKR